MISTFLSASLAFIEGSKLFNSTFTFSRVLDALLSLLCGRTGAFAVFIGRGGLRIDPSISLSTNSSTNSPNSSYTNSLSSFTELWSCTCTVEDWTPFPEWTTFGMSGMSSVVAPFFLKQWNFRILPHSPIILAYWYGPREVEVECR